MSFGKIHNEYLENMVLRVLGKQLNGMKLQDALDTIEEAVKTMYKEAVQDTYPCADCGKPRTKDEGGTVFTVCDTCWGRRHNKEPVADSSKEKS